MDEHNFGSEGGFRGNHCSIKLFGTTRSESPPCLATSKPPRHDTRWQWPSTTTEWGM